MNSIDDSNPGPQGHFETAGQLRITDPCYERGLEGRLAHVVDAVPGRWHYSIRFSRREGGREQILLACVPGTKLDSRQRWQELGMAAVDSGQMGIFDEARFPVGKVGDFEDPASFYGRCCVDTLSERPTGSVAEGCVCSSGWGDGNYPVRVLRDEAGRVIAVRVDFDEDEDVEV